MQEIKIKTHLIVKEVRDEYHTKWCGKILGSNPEFINNKPVFILVGRKGRIEVNTTDMARVEKCARLVTQPKGRSAITTDIAYIYLKEKGEKQKLLGIVTHNHIKEYAQMYDSVGWE